MFLCAVPVLSALIASCGALPPLATGYVEGDYVLIAPVATATIDSLAVRRGDRVAAGQPLVSLERRDAVIALAEARAAVARAEGQLANLHEGRRPEEIRVIEAALASARARADEADRTRARLDNLAASGSASKAQRDDAETAAEVAAASVAEAEANLAVARLPARPQEIAAAEATLAGARAGLAQAQWALDQRSLTAPAAGVIDDLIRHPGELAGPTAPILSLLPDGAVKLRLYVPESDLSGIHPGTRLALRCDGCPPGLTARVSYVSDAPEFTPPVIYSADSRQKLVYLVEARPDGATGLKPGQIVDAVLADD